MLFKQWQRASEVYHALLRPLTTAFTEGLALLLTRVALAGVFWRSGRTKVEAETLITVKDSAYTLFEYEYTGLPLPAELATPLAAYAEHLFPILLVLGLATRFSAMSLLIMTLVIQVFVYPDAWWTTHSLWAAMALVLMVRGGGWLSLDTTWARWMNMVTNKRPSSVTLAPAKRPPAKVE
ncbi:DoxX family protein [uncultured Halopseudomonas sp.]|uniref:DoxX family protein n=1 Tax=uncultured Halopseudomonas sp. TaxID=2901193 RepID=UPI0030EF92F5|tara:strand:- start:138488 stop:139027 length:540 start_codon:yes stop_codon:yes gene_type:complete